MKPQLANDFELTELKYPRIGQPKIDGVRGLHTTGQLTGRSLDPFKGFGVTELFADEGFAGLDGELVLGADPTADRLCSLTTGALGAFKDITEPPDMHWWLFDFLRPETVKLGYVERYEALRFHLDTLSSPRLHLMPMEWISNIDEAKAFCTKCLDQNYEGAIFRNPHALPKSGRPTLKGQELLRYKLWHDFEMRVVRVVEGTKNTNEAKTNSLGYIERSSAQAGKVPNGMIGTLQGEILADVFHPFTGKLLFEKGKIITAGTGNMTEKEARAWFEDQTQIVGDIATIKFTPHGILSEPRFPTFVKKRLKEDMS